jgi:hypothetical protein
VISGPYTKGSAKNGKKVVSLVARLAMKSLLVGILTSAECTTIMTAVLMVTSGLGSSFDWMVWLGIDGFGLVFVELCDHFVPLCAFVIILCDIL